jgi:CHAT domain-containing protein
MNERVLADLTQKLAEDEEAGFQQFRAIFFEALERRRLADCWALLEVLGAVPSPRLGRDYLYHQAILLSEQRQFDQAEIILRRLLAGELSPQQRARALLELAIQLDEQGQWPEAEDFYMKALAAYDLSPDAAGKAETYNNLGISIRFQVEQGEVGPERLQEAISCHQTALELIRDSGELWRVAKNWHGLGMAYSLLRQYPAALAAFETELALCQRLEDPCDRAITLSDMAALVYQPQGYWAEAEAAFDEAITILHGCDDELHLAEALTRQGHLLAQQQRPAKALASYEEALAHAESIRTRLTAPTAQIGYRTTTEFIYAAPVSLYLQQGQAGRAFNAAERARSRVLADLLAGQAVQAQTDLPPDLLARRTVLRQRLDQIYAAEAPASTIIARMEEELANLDRQIELLDPAYASLQTVTALTAEEVSERLPADSVLLTYTGDAGDRLWLLTVSAAGVQATPAPRVTVRWLRSYLADHLDGIRRGSLVPDDRTGHLGPPRLFAPLYETLLAPVMEVLQAARTVYIVPFGPLYYLPLGALTPTLAAPPPLLADGRRVVYAPSATILLNYCHTRPPSPWQSWLAVAPQDRQLQFTQGAAKALTRRNGDIALTGAAATRQAFLEQAGRQRLVCFLGHAYFDQRYPMSSRLRLADGSLHAGDILRDLRLQADLVILSACETGRSRVLRGDEMLGLSRAMLYAGAPSLLATLWPVHEIPTRLLVEKLAEQLSEAPIHAFDPALALATAQRWLRELTLTEAQSLLADWEEAPAAELEAHLLALWRITHPGELPRPDSRLFVHPFFWSPYILMGDQRY